MRIGFVKNKYYDDGGSQYAFSRLSDEFSKRNITLAEYLPHLSYPMQHSPYQAVIFWDKDVALARALERQGVRVFNCAAALEYCDDKQKTFARVAEVFADGMPDGVRLPRTFFSPLLYESCSYCGDYLPSLAEWLSFPMVVKANVGSLGGQVYLVNNMPELYSISAELSHTPHCYQEYVGYRPGVDLRIFIVGGKPFFAAERSCETDFRSNVELGGKMKQVQPPSSITAAAERIAKALFLEFGSVDFLIDRDGYVFLEANSNAYFKGIEGAGANVAQAIAQYVDKSVRQGTE